MMPNYLVVRVLIGELDSGLVSTRIAKPSSTRSCVVEGHAFLWPLPISTGPVLVQVQRLVGSRLSTIQGRKGTPTQLGRVLSVIICGGDAV